jgi:hypothetical protein
MSALPSPLPVFQSVTVPGMVQTIRAIPGFQIYFLFSRICAGGWVGAFGFETVVGGFFNLPGLTLGGEPVGFVGSFPMEAPSCQ